MDILDGHRIPVNAHEREQRVAGVPTSDLFPYYGATGQVGWIDGYLFDEDLLLLGEDGAPYFEPQKSKAYMVRGKVWVNNHAHVLRPRASLMTGLLLCYYLNTFDYHGYVTGTTRYKLNQAPMRRIPLPLPPLPEQRRIVAKIEELFTRLDAGVAALKAAKAQLKRYRQAVLKQAFEGRLTAAWREAHKGELEPASALLERIRAERGTAKGERLPPVDNEGLPELPEGWVWTSLQQVSWDSGYGTSMKCDYGFQGPPVLRIPNVVNGRISLNDMKYAHDALSLKPANAVSPADFLIIRTNGSPDLIGRGALVSESFGEPYFFASYLIRFRILAVDALPGWVSTIWHSPLVRDWISRNAATTAGQYNLSVGKLNKLVLPLAPLVEQRHIIGEVERRFSIADEVEKAIDQSLAHAARLRQSILKRAFEGKLVPQDPADEPAEVLLERTRRERAGGRPGKGEEPDALPMVQERVLPPGASPLQNDTSQSGGTNGAGISDEKMIQGRLL